MLLGRQRERGVLDRLLVAARDGHGGAIIVLGEPGIGKTALIERAVTSAQDFRVLRTAGQEAEMELAFAALLQLCAPGLDRLERLPELQRDALGVVFGLRTGDPPDRLLVALAVLTLLSEMAAQAAAVRCRRRPVARPGVRAGGRLRGAPPGDRGCSVRLRGPGAAR